MTANSPETGFTIQLANTTHSFDGIKDFEQWYRDAWMEFAKYEHSAEKVRARAVRHYNRLEELFKDQSKQSKPADELMKIIRTETKGLFSLIPVPDSPEGKFLQELAKGNPQSAGGALCAIRGHPMQNSSEPHQLRGFVAGSIFAHRNQLHSSEYTKALDSLRESAESWLSRHKTEANEFGAQLRQLVATGTAELGNFAAERERAFNDLARRAKAVEDDWNSAIERHREQLRNLEATYDQKLALQAPTSYWKLKAKHHRDESARWGKWLAASLAVSAVVIMLLFSWFVRSNASSSSGVFDFTRATAFAATLAIVFWSLRTVARNYLSNLHLSVDAEERRLFILTYLSLSRSGQLSDKELMAIVLESIFRSSSDGIVKEEAGPSPMPLLDLISRRN